MTLPLAHGIVNSTITEFEVSRPGASVTAAVKERREVARPVYVISVAADLAGAHPRTLRIYEEKGLLSPVRRNGIRLYSDRDIERILLIRHLTQTLGVNLAGVKLLLEVSVRREDGRLGDVSWSVARRTVRVRRLGRPAGGR